MKRQKPIQNLQKIPSYNLPIIDPNSFNQTIIINNPNFNINYIQSTNPISHRTLQNRKTQQDNWNLNYNLKQFSQTKQIGFFNYGRQKNKSPINSPYLLPKNKTQDVKFNKIKTSQTIKYNEQKNLPKSNRSIPTVIKQKSPPANNNNNVTKYPQQTQLSSFRSKKYAYAQKIQRQQQITKIEEFEKQEPYQEIKIQQYKQKQQKKTLINNILEKNNKIYQRKNKFISEEQLNQEQQEEDAILDTDKTIQFKGYQIKKKKDSNNPYNKTIQIIQHSLLSNIDSYLEGNQTKSELPHSQIQLYITSMKQPEPNISNPQYRSTPIDFLADFDFKFQQQKIKSRPKTPHRRKKYEEL